MLTVTSATMSTLGVGERALAIAGSTWGTSDETTAKTLFDNRPDELLVTRRDHVGVQENYDLHAFHEDAQPRHLTVQFCRTGSILSSAPGASSVRT